MARTLFIPLGGSGGGGGFDPTMYYTKSQVDTLIQDFITRSVNDLVNYYTKSETYTQAEVNMLIGGIESIHFEFAASTSDVQDPQSNVIYLIGPSGTGADQYEEYVYANNQWKKIGDTSIDLSNYATLTDLQNAINTAMATLQQYAVEYFYQKSEVDTMLNNAVSGLQDVITPQNPLSADLLTNGSTNKVFTDTEKTKLAGIEAGAQANVQSNWNETNTSDPSYIQNKPDIPDNLQNMRDVDIATPQNGQVLKFNSTTNQWENANESGGGGVETVELTELTESELGELYEIVVNATPVRIETYLAEHRLVAYGMPVISWGDDTFTIDENSELIADGEGENGAAFYTETNIIKEDETPDTITTYWYCIFRRKEGGNDTYVLEKGTNTYENSGGSTRYDILTKSQAELADFYQNWQTIMASNDVYVGIYPVISVIPEYTVQGYTALLLEYNISFALEADATTQTPVVKGDVGAYYILPNGMGGTYGADVTMSSKNYVDAVANTKQDTLTAGTNISIINNTISAGGGSVALSFTLADDSVVNYTVLTN